jgi:YfiH family protein
MITPDEYTGAAFGTAADGDGRRDPMARARMAERLGISEQWAWMQQVHGAAVARASEPGLQGEADGLYTTTVGLPVAVATADCVPVILLGDGVVAVVHAGWRGVVAGVVPATLRRLDADGLRPQQAAIGPSIGPCCYEVGDDVRDRFRRHRTQTRGDRPSVDLAGAVAEQLNGLTLWRDERCTACGDGLHSYRRSGTTERQVAVAWLS